MPKPTSILSPSTQAPREFRARNKKEAVRAPVVISRVEQGAASVAYAHGPRAPEGGGLMWCAAAWRGGCSGKSFLNYINNSCSIIMRRRRESSVSSCACLALCLCLCVCSSRDYATRSGVWCCCSRLLIDSRARAGMLIHWNWPAAAAAAALSRAKVDDDVLLMEWLGAVEIKSWGVESFGE